MKLKDGPISDPEDTEEPAEKRYETRDELYAALLKALGLQEPQGPSEAAAEYPSVPAIVHALDCTVEDCECVAVFSFLRSSSLSPGSSPTR